MSCAPANETAKVTKTKTMCWSKSYLADFAQQSINGWLRGDYNCASSNPDQMTGHGLHSRGLLRTDSALLKPLSAIQYELKEHLCARMRLRHGRAYTEDFLMQEHEKAKSRGEECSLPKPINSGGCRWCPAA